MKTPQNTTLDVKLLQVQGVRPSRAVKIVNRMPFQYCAFPLRAQLPCHGKQIRGTGQLLIKKTPLLPRGDGSELTFRILVPHKQRKKTFAVDQMLEEK